MRKAIFFGGFLAIAALTAACGGPAANNGSSNNSNAANGNANTLAVQTPTPAPVTNNAPTLTPVIKAYCEALNKKDEAALRKVFSSDTIKSVEEQMKAQKIKTMLEFFSDENVSTTCELTNEQINGDNATAAFRSDTYKTAIPVVFVKENGEWKFTNKSPAVSNMKPSNASNANAAK